MSLLSSVPDPLIPWEIYPDIDPEASLFTQGNASVWLDEIWHPYWATRAEEEKNALHSSAPSEVWLNWLEWMAPIADKEKERCAKERLAFDHNTHLEDYKIQYIRERLQSSTK